LGHDDPEQVSSDPFELLARPDRFLAWHMTTVPNDHDAVDPAREYEGIGDRDDRGCIDDDVVHEIAYAKEFFDRVGMQDIDIRTRGTAARQDPQVLHDGWLQRRAESTLS